MSAVGDRIRKERERLGLSQGSFAELGGVRRRTQIRYENGERSPDAEYFAAISAAGADVDYIVRGDHAARHPTQPKQQQPTPQESEASAPRIEARAVSSSALKEAAGWVDDARFQLAVKDDRVDALDSIRMAMESLRSARTAIINSFPKVIRDGYAARAAELDRGRK